MEFDDRREASAVFALCIRFRNHKFAFRYIPVHFTDPSDLEIAAVGQEEDGDSCAFYGWVIVRSILSSYKGYLTFSKGLLLRVS